MGLILVVVLWGGNNAGTKWLLGHWPPVFTGCMRFGLAGSALLALLRFTPFLGRFEPISKTLMAQLFMRGGLSLAVYTITFNWALRLEPASHVALCLGASPVWALLFERIPARTWVGVRRYLASFIAVIGVLTLFWPTLSARHQTSLLGEMCALGASFVWAFYSRQSRWLAARVNSLEVAAHSMWMAGLVLTPLAIAELAFHPIEIHQNQVFIMSLCVLFGGVVPYAFWNNALRVWPASRVLLFNNLIPVTTCVWVHLTLHEAITPTFYLAMALILCGVILEQIDLAGVFNLPENF